MNRDRMAIVVVLMAAVAVLFGSVGPCGAQGTLTPAQQSRLTGIPDYFNTPNWANSPPLRKFVDTLPPLCGAVGTLKNNLGQCIPVAIPDTTTYRDSDYYEIEIVQYREQMHSDLPPVVGVDKLTAASGGTLLRGYRQTNTGNADLTTPHYLGPVIVAEKGRPVRIKFTNSLPTGAAGNLFIPTDTSIMGSGEFEIDYNPETKDPMALTLDMFTQNRATLHLHGGRSPWISDGTPHQWIAPAGETSITNPPAPHPYPKGVSVAYVPDMWFDANNGYATIASCAGNTECGVAGATNNPGPGSQTFYWTNQQSARMMFYHEHAWGITRLHVYVGAAAGYLVGDPTESSLVGSGVIPGSADTIPLIIQDKTYVDGNRASPTYVENTDPTWIWGSRPGTVSPWRSTNPVPVTGWSSEGAVPVTGDLWWPHVYMTAQNPYNPDLSGINAFGRWHYGPWFWPPTNAIQYGPIPNPYYEPTCNPADPTAPFCQPPFMPAAPNPSWGAEAFMDTPVINGTAYPTMTVQPRAYRLRVLNAAHDRFLNLQLYIAADKSTTNPIDPTDSSSRIDLYWRDTATGNNVKWNMNNNNIAASSSLPAVVVPGWAMVGVADFNGDGKQDIVWRNDTTGQNTVWYMDGSTLLGWTYFGGIVDPGWKIVDVGDFNRDGKPDIVWRNDTLGRSTVWYMDGITMTGWTYIGGFIDSSWTIVGGGDLNKDGNRDLLWRQASTGLNTVWFMNGATMTSWTFLGAVFDPGWTIVGTADLNSDGNLDILWNHSSGLNTVWYMDASGINLQAWEYLPSTAPTWRAEVGGHPGVVLCNGTEGVPPTNCTEVKMIPAVPTAGFPDTWPTDGRVGGVPDPATAGPTMIQIMTEGGFLPEPVVLPNQPVNWNNDPTTFTWGNVLQQNQGGGTLMLGPAERADVIVDFSAFAGKTLILYNDAPAPWPALDPHYDYFTGAPDNRPMGGANTTPPGYGPNTRTLMQIKVAAGTGTPFNLAALQAAFLPPGGPGVFAQAQHEIVVGQSAYDAAYNRTFPATWPYWGISRISDNTLSFHQVNGPPVDNYPMLPKAIQDEMGESFDDFGRASAKLGLELPLTTALNQNFVLQTYVDPPTENMNNGLVQIWKITHNGVDTHPVHFHLFEVQLINRVGWDGFIYLPDPNELGWKETVRVSPLEDTIVAIRPVLPNVPFPVPRSYRPLQPAFPLDVGSAYRLGGTGAVPGFTDLDPTTGQALLLPTTNALTDFKWEYVWHCHILSHEENDMMRSVTIDPGD